MPPLPTVRIVNPQSPGDHIVINESDFDPAVHTKFTEEPRANGGALSQDGPTIEEYVAAGYKPESYPPTGYAERQSPGLDTYRASLKAAPPAIVDLAVAEAKVLVAQAPVEALDAFETAEKAHAKYSGGRQGVLEAIAARRKALAEPAK